ncbi:hypothetical protein NEUTE1DRAFT_65353 [Neurospora tetrasperma FGSC 2508]|uniref:Mid2 domain-containing protein n=1 Tax=Neurospora tetrasperma (strain FGSC 2508 / ATCC MYA-4615 / P0657) TaxID=510951 RepID=F8MQL4_NEUT8|nr:uncharacterized protein NEUTE1DRAFT_65353 [Neurospora tetrasperma FGSC 2508]EGO56644.1 hypothetical protein NEUTE1DRAFT_65353 [Neurospora tetrasperma FGSC 2508]EGZ70482.1 hypothetical protein NEUTE2DRAFT_91898 [Neurospora tetrasperma FGSC 2509]
MSSNNTSTGISGPEATTAPGTPADPNTATVNDPTTAAPPGPTTIISTTSVPSVQPPISTTSSALPTSPSSSSAIPPPSPSSTPTTSTTQQPPPISSTTAPPTTSTPAPPTTTQQPSTETFTSVQIITTEGETRTKITQIITTETVVPSANPTTSSSSTTTSAGAIDATKGASSGGGGLGSGGKIAIAVVVPIVAVALLVLAGIFLWRKRKQRRDAEEQRRREVEDYGYNPNVDPTIPAVAGGGAAGVYEMREDGTSGYRGWGSTTLASSAGRKASTTISGGMPGVAYSDTTSPTRGTVSDARSGEPLIEPPSPEGEILGAMGPSAGDSPDANVHRGPSNASSHYSAAARSDESGEAPIGVAYGGRTSYYEPQYGTAKPYNAPEGAYNGPVAPNNFTPAGPPVIRDVVARRNTRIENSGHYPQQTAGISQNF